ncbi:hypothetical protein [Labilibacter marinus]|uniref:hypothetical protein n=1 Tax=Labilibacter marinus TaxID=1477105 RepID=UPI000835340C|nr:hypothetical protein [Labilibacter marinus]
MILKEYKKQNGEIIKFPIGFSLRIEETSNCVYQIDLFDNQGRSIGNHGTDLDEMIEQAVIDLNKMR